MNRNQQESRFIVSRGGISKSMTQKKDEAIVSETSPGEALRAGEIAKASLDSFESNGVDNPSEARHYLCEEHRRVDGSSPNTDNVSLRDF